jgi:transcription termination/antitermination protein NusA
VREVLVDDDGRQATVIVPDDQLSLAIGREGQNARLAARLTGWRVDIKSETEFSAEEAEHGYDEEDVSGRCSAILSTGRRCPNASLVGSRYCGLDSHQALRRFDTDKVEVLSGLAAADIAALADGDSSDDEVAEIVARAAPAAPEPAGDAPADAAPPGEPETQAPEAETPHAAEPETETPEAAEPAETLPAEEALAEDAAPAPDGRPATDAPAAGTAGEGAAP